MREENNFSFSFPGLASTEEVLGFLKMFTSKSPDTSLFSSATEQYRETVCKGFNKECPKGYALDPMNFICYKIVNRLLRCGFAFMACTGI